MPGFNSTQNKNFQMFKLDLEKAEKPEIKLPTSAGSSKKQENSRKTSTSASLIVLKPLTVWIITNSWKILKERGFPGGSDCKESAHNAGDLGLIPGSGRAPGEGNGNPRQYSCPENSTGEDWQATVHGVTKSRTLLSDFPLPVSWETCMQVKKQHSDPDMLQWTGSKLGNEYVKAVCCHPAYLTSMQSISGKMLGWMKHKRESRLPGEISITSDTQMIHPYGRKQRRSQEPLDANERGEWKCWLKTQHSEN